MGLAALTSRRAAPIVVVLLVVLSLLPERWVRVARPVGEIATIITSPISRLVHIVSSDVRQGSDVPASIVEEWEPRLKDNMIVNYQARIAQLEFELAELQGHRQLAGHRSKLLLAGVVGRNANPGPLTLNLDKGAREGLAEGQPVVASQSVVGRLISVDHRLSTFEPITRRDQLIDAIITPRDLPEDWTPRGAARCQFQATGPHRLVARDVDSTVSVSVGDYARLKDNTWPRAVQGWVFGEVVDVQPADDAPLRQRVVIEPLVRIRYLQAATVIIATEDNADPAPGVTP